jgi:hypothetical protein
MWTTRPSSNRSSTCNIGRFRRTTPNLSVPVADHSAADETPADSRANSLSLRYAAHALEALPLGAPAESWRRDGPTPCAAGFPTGGHALNAIKEIRKYLEKNAASDGAKTLARLVAALAEERAFSLAELYRLDYDQFQLALDLLKDWRLDRYYAARLRLFDVVLNDVLTKEAPPSS